MSRRLLPWSILIVLLFSSVLPVHGQPAAEGPALLYSANGTAVMERIIEWFGGCSAETGQLQGQVVDEQQGTPLSDVELTVEPQLLPAQLTDSSGRYTMTLPAGYYALTAARPGYITATVPTVLVLPGQSTVLDLALRRQEVLLYLPLLWVGEGGVP